MFLSAKNKTLLFVTIVFAFFITILSSAIYVNQKNNLQTIQNSFQKNIQNSHEKILLKHKEFYYNRTIANINSKGVIETFAQRDREKLYELTQGRWKTLRKENPYLKIMHFHLPDGKSFLRMHEPNHYGDRIADTRAMIAKVHQTKNVVSGFERGLSGLAFRIAVPVFKEKNYIGALEFGSSPEQILKDMKYFYGLSGALFVQASTKTFTLQSTTISDESILTYLKTIHHDFNTTQSLKLNDRTYNIYTFNLYDFAGNISAKAFFVQDITSAYQEFQKTITELVILILGLFGLVILVINFGFNKIVSALDRTNIQLKKNKLFMKSILDNSAHAIIATTTDGVITLFNPQAQKLLGYTEEEMIGIHTPAIFHKTQEVHQRALELSAQFNTSITQGFNVFIAKTKYGLENNDYWTYITKDEHELIVHLHITELRDGEGNLTGYLGIAENVTDRAYLENELKRKNEELETILSTSRDGIAILDMQTNFLYANNAYLSMTGFRAEELYNKSCAGLSAPEDLPRAIRILGEVVEKGFVDNFEKTCIVKHGKRVIVNMAIALMTDRERLLITTKDVTYAKKIEQETTKYIKLIDDNVITSTTDLEGTIISASQAFCHISGYSKEELIGQNHRLVRHSDMSKETYKQMWQKLTHGETWEGEIKNRAKDGSYYWVHAKIYPLYTQEGEKYGYTAIRTDITDKKRIEELSITDGLTSIYNRRYFNDLFPKFIQSSIRSDDISCFILMDVDYFKQYNDTYGHQMGDTVLIQVAETIKHSLRRTDDYCFRIGGEEFGILFKTQIEKNAVEFAETLRQSIENLHIRHEKNATGEFVTVSMGLVILARDVLPSCDTIYKQSDDLLYEAKSSGRNRICFANVLKPSTKVLT